MLIHYVYVDILSPLTKVIQIMFECINTHYQTLKTSVGHNTTRYHNFNALPHSLLYILSQFNMDKPYATHYHNFNALPHSLPYILSQFNMDRP